MEGASTQIVHELAVVAGAEVAGLAWVVVAVADAAVVAVAVVARCVKVQGP